MKKIFIAFIVVGCLASWSFAEVTPSGMSKDTTVPAVEKKEEGVKKEHVKVEKKVKKSTRKIKKIEKVEKVEKK